MQTLRTFQSTPYTVQYIVSTRPNSTNLLSKGGKNLNGFVRVVLGLSIFAILWTKWRITSEQPVVILQQILNSKQETWVHDSVKAIAWPYLAPPSLVFLFLLLRRGYTEESLTVLHGLGVQTSTSSSLYLVSPSMRFIPTTSIQDMIIHEAFKGFEVRFYLAIIVEGEDKVVVVFPRLLPRRAMLEEVWRGARKSLWESKGSKAD